MTWAFAKTPSSIRPRRLCRLGQGPSPREGLVSLPLRTRCARLAETQEVLVRFQKVGRKGPGTARHVRAVANRPNGAGAPIAGGLAGPLLGVLDRYGCGADCKPVADMACQVRFLGISRLGLGDVWRRRLIVDEIHAGSIPVEAAALFGPGYVWRRSLTVYETQAGSIPVGAALEPVANGGFVAVSYTAGRGFDSHPAHHLDQALVARRSCSSLVMKRREFDSRRGLSSCVRARGSRAGSKRWPLQRSLSRRTRVRFPPGSPVCFCARCGTCLQAPPASFASRRRGAPCR